MTTPTDLNVVIKPLSKTQPWEWLVLGWKDFKQSPAIGLTHGLLISGFGLALLVLAYDHFWILAGAFSGFLLVAPVIAIGLYGVSQGLEKGVPVNFQLIFSTWMSWRGKPRHDWRLIRFAVLLGASGTGWVLTSAALITLFAAEPVIQPLDFLHHVVLAKEGFLFELWLVLGGLLAAPVFTSTVVTLPLLLDRKIKLFDAVLVSWKVVMENPVQLAAWAALILVATLIGFLTLVGGLVVIPVLGHASWHAYRQCVDASHLSPRI